MSNHKAGKISYASVFLFLASTAWLAPGFFFYLACCFKKQVIGA